MNIEQNELLDKAKEQINLEEYARTVLPSHEFKGGGKSTFVEECPVCKGHDHFSINKNENYYNSFAKCCKGGSIVDFMMEVEQLSKKDAIRKTLELAGYGETMEVVNGTYSKPMDSIALEVNNHEPVILVSHPNPPDFTSLILETHSLVSQTDYFLNRGLTLKTIEQYKLGYHAEGFNFAISESGLKEKENDLMRAYKYFLPVWDADNVCRYFINRLDDRAVPSWAKSYGKTHNPKEMKIRLFNDRYLHGYKVQGEFVFITEGIFDALSLEEFDYPAIALNSVENANLLIETLRNAPQHIRSKTFILIPDNDKTGERLRIKLEEKYKKLGLELKVIKLPPEYKDCNEFLVANRESANKFIQKNLNILQHNDFASDYLDDFRKTIVHVGDNRVMKTGFKGLDDILGGGLYPGLYVIGAITSLGKTTLVLQIADEVARNGDDVLSFSLEMGRYELISRSVSRELFTISRSYKYSAREIREGKCSMEILDKGMERYKKIGINVAIVEGNLNLGVKEIRERVEQNIRLRGKKPLLVVDYLQILKPLNLKMSDKQATDYNISELKRISRDYNIPVIVVSSLNRSNYTSAVGYESFKETGAIEYSADVVIGMQLKGIEEVSKLKTETDKRNLVNKLKDKKPREIEVEIIKQRDGCPYGSQEFMYFAKQNFFQEV